MRRGGVALVVGCLLLLGWERIRAQSPTASVAGVVNDVAGTPVAEAQVSVAGANGLQREVASDEDGEFVVDGLPAGVLTLTVAMPGFQSATASVQLSAGEHKVLPEISLRLATVSQQVDAVSQVELANEQIKVEEKQRVFGVIPNFFVAYDPNTVPLTAQQKFRLSTKTLFDPVTIATAAANAGLNQATQTPVEWGQTWKGYGQRLGAAFAGAAAGIELSGAVYPGIFHEDPRYFYKGTGTTWARLRWSLKQAVEQRNDKGQWRPAYSNMLGDLSASLVTVAIYPHQTTSWGTTAGEDLGLNIAGEAFGNVMEEFVVPKLPRWKKKAATP